jgi:hypothetical protein
MVATMGTSEDLERLVLLRRARTVKIPLCAHPRLSLDRPGGEGDVYLGA